ncbi:hypothetical protein J21TS7_28200 [Paenibacillus cineris]|uniref:Uncharacterized protein n=1 Tax=Paenibacillus cineris TaxID=237530 RepID=A0ABQ4LD77_9BACL|nr:hypothetical protein J21TS7_28200 [Paenibacillus cineris]
MKLVRIFGSKNNEMDAIYPNSYRVLQAGGQIECFLCLNFSCNELKLRLAPEFSFSSAYPTLTNNR